MGVHNYTSIRKSTSMSSLSTHFDWIKLFRFCFEVWSVIITYRVMSLTYPLASNFASHNPGGWFQKRFYLYGFGYSAESWLYWICLSLVHFDRKTITTHAPAMLETFHILLSIFMMSVKPSASCSWGHREWFWVALGWLSILNTCIKDLPLTVTHSSIVYITRQFVHHGSHKVLRHSYCWNYIKCICDNAGFLHLFLTGAKPRTKSIHSQLMWI